MITLNEVKEISRRLSLENCVTNDDSSEDISYIVYRVEVLGDEDPSMIDRHVDIEYSFGEYFEIAEGTPLFEFICGLCDLPLSNEEQETILWEE